MHSLGEIGEWYNENFGFETSYAKWFGVFGAIVGIVLSEYAYVTLAQEVRLLIVLLLPLLGGVGLLCGHLFTILSSLVFR